MSEASGGFWTDGKQFSATINGFRTVPAVRTTRAKMHVDPAYERYSAMKDELRARVYSLINESGGVMFPAKTTLRVRLTIGKSQTGKFGIWSCDIDNLAKSVLDALNGVVYADDRYIAELSVRKIPVQTDDDEYLVVHVESFIGGYHVEGEENASGKRRRNSGRGSRRGSEGDGSDPGRKRDPSGATDI